MRRGLGAFVAGVVALALAYALYRDGRPNAAGRAFGAFWTFVNRRGLTPPYLVALETVGRCSGQSHAIPMVVAVCHGQRYLVSMLGEGSPWAHNVRAAGEAIITHGAAHQRVPLVEVPAGDRAPIIKVYVGRAVGARPHVPVAPTAPVAAFEAIAADYPVFRIDA